MLKPSAFVVPAGIATFVANGGRDADCTKVEAVGALANGAHVKLVDDRDAELGLAVYDADNARLRVMATPADGFVAIDAAVIAWHVERAIRLRRAIGLVEPGAAYRAIHGAGDGLPGITCDVLGEVAVVYAYGDGLRAIGKQVAEAVVGFAKLAGAVVKLRARGGAADAPSQDVVGKVAESCLADELGAKYEIHPLGGLNAGLFTDMREHRRGLARFARDRRVLNLFAYTGALGLACARAGAAHVTNVDTAEGVNAWARGNFVRNGCADRATFHTGDAGRFLARAVKDREQYDLVVIDPPTYSPAKGGAGWVLDRDYPELISRAATTIPSGGLLWLAANTHELAALSKIAFKGLKLAARTAAILEQGGLPPDYPTLVAQPADRYLQVLLLRLA